MTEQSQAEDHLCTRPEPEIQSSPAPDPTVSTPLESGHVAVSKSDAKKRERGSKGQDNGLPPAERQGFLFARDLEHNIKNMGGRYLRDEDGNLFVLLEGLRIPLNFDRDNHSLATLMLKVCNVSTLSLGAQSAIQRLQCIADPNASKMRFRRFSALIDEKLYIPIAGKHILCATSDRLTLVKNGINQDSVWVVHPEEDPFQFVNLNQATGLEELARFERLCVDTQACVQPAMRWFVAMQEGLFPFVRDACPARFITEHIGPSQDGGKTTGAQRFTLLHGLGEVKGSCTAAALGNMGDIGLLVADNKEQANWNVGMIDYFLFLSTGATRERSTSEGEMRAVKRGRPVGVITTIEGVSKDELQNRTVEVEYLVAGPKLDRAPIENEIRGCRHGMSTALVFVLQRWLGVRGDCRPTPNPLPNFRENFQTVADLLRAYSEVARKPEGWADQIISEWGRAVAERGPDHEDEFEHPIRRIIREGDFGLAEITVSDVEYSGRNGKLYVTDWGSLLSSLQRLNLRALPLPKNTNGLSRRIRNAKFLAFELLDEKKAPNIQELRHTETRKVVGFFFQEDSAADPAAPR